MQRLLVNREELRHYGKEAPHLVEASRSLLLKHKNIIATYAVDISPSAVSLCARNGQGEKVHVRTINAMFGQASKASLEELSDLITSGAEQGHICTVDQIQVLIIMELARKGVLLRVCARVPEPA